jgi:hypothetical protein
MDHGHLALRAHEMLRCLLVIYLPVIVDTCNGSRPRKSVDTVVPGDELILASICCVLDEMG